MIAYNKTRHANLLDCDQAKRFARSGLINENELKEIALAKQPTYHRTNIFIRIGVLLLTIILTFCSYGLIVLFFGLDSEWGFRTALLIFSITTIAALEFFIKSKNHFASGVDDGLTYFALACFSTLLGFVMLPSSSLSWMIYFALMFVAFLFSFIRYADRLVSLVCYVNFLLTVFYAAMQLGEISKLIMPFVMMLISIGTFLFVTHQNKKYEFRYWSDGLKVLQYASLLSFYAAGNYYVVREAGVQFFGMEIIQGGDIPLSVFFYSFTILVPLIYVYMGLKKKDGLFLNCGLILIIAAIATIRYYYSVMPIEIALILGGATLLAIAWFTFRFLKTPNNGFTIEEDKSEPGWFTKDIQSLIMAQAIAQQATAPKNDSDGFGGGKFGGGGAGQSF